MEPKLESKCSFRVVNLCFSFSPPACHIQEHHQYGDNIYTIDGVILYKDNIVIPLSFRENILNILHSVHQSVAPMLLQTISTVFWPGITAAVQAHGDFCADCHRNVPSWPSAPPYIVQTPKYHFHCICAGFFSHQGTQYLVTVDQYSNWPLIERTPDSFRGLIECVHQLFATYGIPNELASDGKPEFPARTTSNFLQNWGVSHCLPLLFHTQTVRQKWLLKEPRAELHQVQEPVAVSIPMPFKELFFNTTIPPTP